MTVDDMSFYVYFSIFLVIIFWFWSNLEEFLEQSSMVFGTFCNVFISSHVILVFQKQNNS